MEEVKVRFSHSIWSTRILLRIDSDKLKICIVNQKMANIITYTYIANKLWPIKQKMEMKWNNRSQWKESQKKKKKVKKKKQDKVSKEQIARWQV